jgi:hypothetical protein
MGIDHGVANLERHVTGTPSVAIQGNTGTPSSEWRLRRSEHISGLDKRPRDVLEGAPFAGYPQVGAGMRGGRNVPVTGSSTVEQGAVRPYLSLPDGWIIATPFGNLAADDPKLHGRGTTAERRRKTLRTDHERCPVITLGECGNAMRESAKPGAAPARRPRGTGGTPGDRRDTGGRRGAPAITGHRPGEPPPRRGHPVRGRLGGSVI